MLTGDSECRCTFHPTSIEKRIDECDWRLDGHQVLVIID